MAERGTPPLSPIRRARVRNALEADASQMVELLFRAFKRWPEFELFVSPVEHLLWKMRSGPTAARHQWVSEVDGRIAAMVVIIVRRIRMRGRDYVVRHGADAAVDPEYQKRGLYGAMIDYARHSPQTSEFDLGFGFTTNPRVRRPSRREGRMALANPIQVLEKPYSARAIVARRRERYGGRLPSPLAVLRIKLGTVFNRLGHPPYWRRVKPTWSITTRERFDDRIEGFFDEAARPFDLVIVKSRDYMNWRYSDPAAGRFTIRVAEQDGSILGYLVLKVSEGSGYIVDLLALPDRIDVMRSLVEDALHLFSEAGVDLVTCWMISRHPYNPILRRYGFIDTRRDVGFRYRAVSLDESTLEFLTDAGARIHLMHGDSDWV